MYRRKLSKRPLVVGVLAMLMFATVGISWAFWYAGINNADTQLYLNVEIGDAGRVRTTLTAVNSTTPDGTLIPYDRTPRQVSDTTLTGVNDVNYLDFVVNVTWNSYDPTRYNILCEEGILTVSMNEVLVGGVALGFAQDMFNVQIRYGGADVANRTILASPTPTSVTIRVTMNNPANQAEFLQIRTQQVQFDVEFAVEAVNYDFIP